MLQNLHRRSYRYYIGQIYGGDFAKICGLLRIYELYEIHTLINLIFAAETVRGNTVCETRLRCVYSRPQAIMILYKEPKLLLLLQFRLCN